MIQTTTMTIILVTIFIKGGLTSVMIDWLGIPRGLDPDEHLEKVNRRVGGGGVKQWRISFMRGSSTPR